MKQLELNLATPAEILAADEALLDWGEAGDGDELLLFWEPRETFVVVGYANQVATEVNVAACADQGVPIYRRCSGGGTVLQMPGGLNYSLILQIKENSPTRSITSTNNFIMEKNRAAIESIPSPGSATLSPLNGERDGVRSAKPLVSVRGHTDLCRGDLKFSGNSQRRRKNFLLFHGTLLLNCDLRRISELLRMPTLQPDYRARRSHEEFVTNLNLPAETVKAALASEWNANAALSHPPMEAITRLTREKYSKREWNWKF